MQILIRPTEQMTTVEGAPVRVWHGVTGRGVECIIFVRLLAVHNAADSDEFDRELREVEAPAELLPFKETLA